MAVRYHYLPFGRLINDFVEVDKAIFQDIGRPWEFIFCIPRNYKSDLDEVVIMMFQVGELP
jgi:hypothetical protein